LETGGERKRWNHRWTVPRTFLKSSEECQTRMDRTNRFPSNWSGAELPRACVFPKSSNLWRYRLAISTPVHPGSCPEVCAYLPGRSARSSPQMATYSGGENRQKNRQCTQQCEKMNRIRRRGDWDRAVGVPFHLARTVAGSIVALPRARKDSRLTARIRDLRAECQNFAQDPPDSSRPSEVHEWNW